MKKILVLVVDDDEDIVTFIVTCLKSEKYECEFAYGGEDGLKKAREVKPNLIILDLMMPDMHGFDVCQRLRSDEGFKETKILISSGKGYAVDQRAAKKLGADAFITKPYTANRLIETVKGMVGDP